MSIRKILLFVFFLHGNFSMAQDKQVMPHYLATKIDDSIRNFMQRWDVKGSDFTIARERLIVYEKGYGFADDYGTRVDTDNLFRIASVSKTFTAVAIMQLFENDKFKLDDCIFLDTSLLGMEFKNIADTRLKKITIRMLLQHLGGWDRAESDDPTFLPIVVANIEGVSSPPNKDTVIRYVVENMQLDHNPGTTFAYSNFGYSLLGKIIEKKSHLPYAEYVKQNILAKVGISDMIIGNTIIPSAKEVHYYDYKYAPAVKNCFDTTKMAQNPYGGFDMVALDAFGGWIASSDDLVDYLIKLQSADKGLFTKLGTLDTMLQTTVSSKKYAMGFWIGDDGSWYHSGSLPGSTSYILHTSDGFDCAILFNSRAEDHLMMLAQMKELLYHIITIIKQQK